MFGFLRALHRLIFGYTNYEIKTTMVNETQKNDLVFAVLYNGYDYEVKITSGESVIYHSVGFASIDEANNFVEFYKRQI